MRLNYKHFTGSLGGMLQHKNAPLKHLQSRREAV
jgi:hypothetical protein